MSSKIPKNLSSNDDPSASESDMDMSRESLGAESRTGDADNVDSQSEPSHFDDTDVEEFSLDQLSQAYARVLKGTTGAFGSIAGAREPGTEASAVDSPVRARAIAASQAGTEPTEFAAEEDDNTACPITPESIVESILFVGAPAGVKLTPRMIAAVIRDVSPKEISNIVKQLNSRYAAENAVYRIKTIDGGLKLELDESLHTFQQEFFGRNKSVKLSQAAVEVLAVVAYNQPITRDQLDKLRGKPSGGVLSQLMRRELLTHLDSDKTTDTKQFVTTDKFLDFFHLAELTDLPQSHEVSDLDELAD